MQEEKDVPGFSQMMPRDGTQPRFNIGMGVISKKPSLKENLIFNFYFQFLFCFLFLSIIGQTCPPMFLVCSWFE